MAKIICHLRELAGSLGRCAPPGRPLPPASASSDRSPRSRSPATDLRHAPASSSCHTEQDQAAQPPVICECVAVIVGFGPLFDEAAEYELPERLSRYAIFGDLSFVKVLLAGDN